VAAFRFRSATGYRYAKVQAPEPVFRGTRGSRRRSPVIPGGWKTTAEILEAFPSLKCRTYKTPACDAVQWNPEATSS
jgi:hypothetical protein